jgi:hypothetical protein
MKTFEIDRTSWHYRLASFYGDLTTSHFRWGDVDFCSYWRRVFFAALRLIILAGILSVLLSLTFGDLLVWGTWMLLNGVWVDPGEGSIIAMGLLGVATLVAGIVAALHYGKQVLDRHREESGYREPGFIGQTYQSWKNKYCMKVELKD